MSEPSPARMQRPLEIDRIERSSTAAGQVELQLSGRWADPDRAVGQDQAIGQDQELLVVTVRGRRHRFPARREVGADEQSARARWSATFVVPVWAVPREQGQAALWLGTAVIPVPSQAELVAQATRYGEPERTSAELRGELAAAQASRDVALREAAGLRSELERIGTELAATREQLRSESGNLGEANQLLADAKELAEELRSADAIL